MSWLWGERIQIIEILLLMVRKLVELTDYDSCANQFTIIDFITFTPLSGDLRDMK